MIGLVTTPLRSTVVQVSLRDWCNSIKQAATVDKRLQRIRFAFVLPRTDSAHADTYRVVMVPDISHAVWNIDAETGESLSALLPSPWGDFHNYCELPTVTELGTPFLLVCAITVCSALCFDEDDKRMICHEITNKFGYRCVLPLCHSLQMQGA